VGLSGRALRLIRSVCTVTLAVPALPLLLLGLALLAVLCGVALYARMAWCAALAVGEGVLALRGRVRADSRNIAAGMWELPSA
jgi:hypothetical protein